MSLFSGMNVLLFRIMAKKCINYITGEILFPAIETHHVTPPTPHDSCPKVCFSSAVDLLKLNSCMCQTCVRPEARSMQS